MCPGRIEETGDSRKAGTESHKRNHTLNGPEIVEFIFIILQIPERFTVGDLCDDIHGEELTKSRKINMARIGFCPEILPLYQHD
jgi:hypothetical protein